MHAPAHLQHERAHLQQQASAYCRVLGAGGFLCARYPCASRVEGARTSPPTPNKNAPTFSSRQSTPTPHHLRQSRPDIRQSRPDIDIGQSYKTVKAIYPCREPYRFGDNLNGLRVFHLKAKARIWV